MQLSTRSKDYIVDTLMLREHMHILNEVFTNPRIVKVGMFAYVYAKTVCTENKSTSNS